MGIFMEISTYIYERYKMAEIGKLRLRFYKNNKVFSNDCFIGIGNTIVKVSDLEKSIEKYKKLNDD